MNEFFLTNKPNVYPDVVVRDKVQKTKLNVGGIVHASKFHLMNDPDGYAKHLQRELAMTLVDQALAENKIKFVSYDNPTYDSRDLRAETLIMTYDDLYKLLGEFGIQIKKTERDL